MVDGAIDAKTEFKMNRMENRINSFKDWPFDNDISSCTSKKMAIAGFFHTPSETQLDLVKCFVCLKELDGWEPEDDPWSEHKSHAPKCPLIKLNKKEEDWKVEDIIKMEVHRQRAIVQTFLQQEIDTFKNDAADLRKVLEDL